MYNTIGSFRFGAATVTTIPLLVAGQQQHNISGILRREEAEMPGRKFIARTLKMFFFPPPSFFISFFSTGGEQDGTILIFEKYIIKVAPASSSFFLLK